MAGERLSEWYRGKSVLVTGGTGFLGKVLIEKLLRSCPEIGTVYVLCRHRQDKTPITRLADLIITPTIFDRLKKENPGVLNKLVAVAGDIEHGSVVTKDKDRDKVIQEVSVVFHLAASPKTETLLADAVRTNVKGTLNLLEFCKTFKQLKVLVNISTVFCHHEPEVIQEKYYAPPMDPYQVLNLVASADSSSLKAMTPGILGQHPDCYTFSKSIAETIVSYYSQHISTLTIRLPAVTPGVYEPVPGWVDSLDGPTGTLIGVAKGVVKSIICNKDDRAEIMPVDLAANSIMCITANHSRTGSDDKKQDCYNVSSSEFFPVTWGDWFDLAAKQFGRYPLESGLWYPGCTVGNSAVSHALLVLLLQTIPAYLIDLVLVLFHQKAFLVRMQKGISARSESFKYLSTRKWNIKTDNGVDRQVKHMHPEDKKIFYFNNIDRDVNQYMLKVVLGARQYCTKEPLSTLNKAKLRYWLLFLANLAAKAALCYLVYRNVLALIRLIDPSFEPSLPRHDWFDRYLRSSLSEPTLHPTR